MKLRYIGPDMIDIKNGKIYECIRVEFDGKCYRIIDESGDDYLYSAQEPSPLFSEQAPGRWEIVEA